MARFSLMNSDFNYLIKHKKNNTMKKLLLLPLFFIGFATVAKAQAPVTSGVESKNGPVMTFEVTEYTFEPIKQGEIVTREYKFKNTGKEPLIINNAVGSCGCTVPEWPHEPIKPNGTGVIKVTFNSAGKMGAQDKTVTLTYDTDKTIVLHLKGTVEAPAATTAPQTPASAPATGNGSGTATAPKTATSTTTSPATTTATPPAATSTAPATTSPSKPKAKSKATAAPASAEKPKH